MNAATCNTPLGFEELVDYFAGELALQDSERVEEHLFGCAACTAQAGGLAVVAAAFQTDIPTVVSAEQVLELKARGIHVDESPVLPGVRKHAVYPRGSDILLFRLQGLDLRSAERVEVRVRSESSGAAFIVDHFAPFDRERGEVLVACQSHFSIQPHDIVFDVSALEPSGRVSVSTYFVPHSLPG